MILRQLSPIHHQQRAPSVLRHSIPLQQKPAGWGLVACSYLPSSPSWLSQHLQVYIYTPTLNTCLDFDQMHNAHTSQHACSLFELVMMHRSILLSMLKNTIIFRFDGEGVAPMRASPFENHVPRQAMRRRDLRKELRQDQRQRHLHESHWMWLRVLRACQPGFLRLRAKPHELKCSY